MNVFEFLSIESIRGRRLSGLRLSRLPGFSLDVVNAPVLVTFGERYRKVSRETNLNWIRHACMRFYTVEKLMNSRFRCLERKVRYLFFNRSIHFFSQRKWQILSACFRYRKWLSSDWERIPPSIFFDSGKKWKFERTKFATAGRKFVRNCGGRAYPHYKGEMQL